MIGRILGFYFARRFASAVALIFLSCVGLIMLVDFLEMARRTADKDHVTTSMVALVTLYRAPAFTEQLLPFAVLFGAMATFVVLSRNLELVVARAAGLSAWQFITRPSSSPFSSAFSPPPSSIRSPRTSRNGRINSKARCSAHPATS